MVACRQPGSLFGDSRAEADINQPTFPAETNRARPTNAAHRRCDVGSAIAPARLPDQMKDVSRTLCSRTAVLRTVEVSFHHSAPGPSRTCVRRVRLPRKITIEVRS